MQTQKHIINKVFLEVNTNSKRVAYELKDQLGVLIEQELLPILDKYFDKIINDKNLDIIQLENIQLNINHNKQDDYKQLTKRIKESFIKTFEKKLKSSNTEEIQFITKQKNVLNSFFIFLEEGVLPWNSLRTQNMVFDSESIITLSKHTGFKSLFKEKLKKQNTRIRLINQFDNQKIAILLKKTFEEQKHHQSVLSDAVIHTINKVNPINRRDIWLEIITYLLTNNKQKFIKRMSQFIETIKNQSNLKVHQKEKMIVALTKIIIKLYSKESSSLTIKNQSNLKVKQKEEIMDVLTQTINKPSSKESSNLTISAESKSSLSNEDVGEYVNKKAKRVSKLSQKSLNNQLTKNTKEDESQRRSMISKTEKLVNNSIKSKSELQSDSKQSNNSQDTNATIDNVTRDIKLTKQKDVLSLEEIISEKDLFKGQDNKEYYVQNAGLILIHPFLKQFFNSCGLLDKKNRIIDKELAAHLLHYIANQNERQLESNMVFEKFLCGIPITQSIKREISISNKLKEQANDLLQSVLDNWEILKNASIDLLRNEFLQRPGKLSFKAENPKIIIERKTQDILIDKIPWNLSISKLPWIEKIIFTDW